MSRPAAMALSVTALFAAVGAFALDPPKARSSGTAPTGSIAPVGTKAPRVLTWDDLIPLEERDRPYAAAKPSLQLFDDETGPAAEQEGSAAINKSLDGQRVKLPGFVVPLAMDRNMRTSNFLLVPYFGACIHNPPPPPNQIVHVVMDKPVLLESMYEPVWVMGTLSTQSYSSELATAAYSLSGNSIERYEE